MSGARDCSCQLLLAPACCVTRLGVLWWLCMWSRIVRWAPFQAYFATPYLWCPFSFELFVVPVYPFFWRSLPLDFSSYSEIKFFRTLGLRLALFGGSIASALSGRAFPFGVLNHLLLIDPIDGISSSSLRSATGSTPG